MSKLADDLERLYCAETEGKFFDCVTDNIGAIISALRTPARCDAEPVAWRIRHNSSSRWEYRDERPNGPSVHLFDVEPLYVAPVSRCDAESSDPQTAADTRHIIADEYEAGLPK